MIINRRTLFGLIAAPAIIRVADIMPIKALTTGQREWWWAFGRNGLAPSIGWQAWEYWGGGPDEAANVRYPPFFGEIDINDIYAKAVT